MDIYFPDDVELQSSETAIYITYTIGGSTVHVGNIHLHISTYRTVPIRYCSQVKFRISHATLSTWHLDHIYVLQYVFRTGPPYSPRPYSETRCSLLVWRQ